MMVEAVAWICTKHCSKEKSAVEMQFHQSLLMSFRHSCIQPVDSLSGGAMSVGRCALKVTEGQAEARTLQQSDLAVDKMQLSEYNHVEFDLIVDP